MKDDEKKLVFSFFKVYFLVPVLGPLAYVQGTLKTIREGSPRIRLAMALLLCPVAGSLAFAFMGPRMGPASSCALVGGLFLFVGLAELFFLEEMAVWTKNCRDWFSRKLPEWEKLGGVSPEGLEYYRSVAHHKKMIKIGALLLIILGILLSFASILLFP